MLRIETTSSRQCLTALCGQEMPPPRLRGRPNFVQWPLTSSVEVSHPQAKSENADIGLMEHQALPLRRHLGVPVLPAVGIVVLAFAATGLHTSHTRWQLVADAAVAAAGLMFGGLLVPWPRLPSSWLLLLPLGCDAVIAVLRQAQGGSASGYAPLAALPVVWVGLTLGRKAVAVTALATAALFGLPILFLGPPLYPGSGWRGVVLWTAVALIVGLVVNWVVAEQRRQASLTLTHAHELAETQRALSSVASLARHLSTATPAQARQMICRAAFDAEEATLATIVEPDTDGGFKITGSAGIPIAHLGLQETVRPQASLRAFYARERLLITDAADEPSVSPLIVAATGLTSILYEPILRHDRPIGVLCVGWKQRRESLSERAVAVYSSLAAEAGAAIERADLLFRLEQLARTDELTGLPNRRAWEDALENAAVQRDRPFSVALIDLDHFKAYNDNLGHPEGDSLLRDAATAWTAKLRAGDILARYGGEEFALLLLDTTPRQAEEILERLRRATPGNVTCSAGITRSDGAQPHELMRRADAALYKAKNAGRNRIIAA